MAYHSVTPQRTHTGAVVLNSTYTQTHNMKTTQQILDLTPRPKLRLSEIERLIRIHRIVTPVPSRSTLAQMCEDGTFETAARSNERQPWLVYEDSFLKWVEELDG